MRVFPIVFVLIFAYGIWAQTEQISIRLKTEILDWFRNHAQEKGYQALINDVLRTYVKHQS